MILRIGNFLALAVTGLAYVVLLPLQVFAMKTGWFDENLCRSLLHRTNLWALGIRVHRVGALSDHRPLLIASNHVSWTDISVLASIVDVSFIAKAEVAGWPVIGWLSSLQRCVYVERDRKGQSGKQADEIAGRLTENRAMVLFAEGTTGDGNMLLPFKSTLFGAATRALSNGRAERAYIQPVALVYTRIHGLPMGRRHRSIASWIGGTDLGPHVKAMLAAGPIDVEVHFGEPIEIDAGSDRKAMAREAEARVNALLQHGLRNPMPSR